MKKKITIQQKMSGTGDICDIASSNYDRVINMGEDFQFAVVLPVYYRDGVTRHKTANAAIRVYKKLTHDGFNGACIISRDGDFMLLGSDDSLHFDFNSDAVTVKTETPEKYRFITGTLYEYYCATNAYVAVFTNAYCNTKAKAIKAYEKTVVADL